MVVFEYTSVSQLPVEGFVYYAPDRMKGGNKSGICPSVCLSVRPSRTGTWRIIPERKGLACPYLEGRFPL